MRVVKHFHAGPDSPEDCVYAEDVDCCNQSYNGHWNCVYPDPCCACWHDYYSRCPNYDDTDNENYYEATTHWPGKNETSWMHELDPW